MKMLGLAHFLILPLFDGKTIRDSLTVDFEIAEDSVWFYIRFLRKLFLLVRHT
jgi:hypothetical protein